MNFLQHLALLSLKFVGGKLSFTRIMALVASIRKDGWCLINSSIALPRLLAVSPGIRDKI